MAKGNGYYFERNQNSRNLSWLHHYINYTLDTLERIRTHRKGIFQKLHSLEIRWKFTQPLPIPADTYRESRNLPPLAAKGGFHNMIEQDHWLAIISKW